MRSLIYRLVHLLRAAWRGWLLSRHLFIVRLHRASLLDTLEELEAQYAQSRAPDVVDTLLATRRQITHLTTLLDCLSLSRHRPLVTCVSQPSDLLRQ